MPQVMLENDGGWYCEDAIYYPKPRETLKNVERYIHEHILPGHIPEQPILSAQDSVITLGSCFARELRHFLERYGLSATNFYVSSGHNNTFALSDYIRWCEDGTTSENSFHYDFQGEEEGITNQFPSQERVNNLECLKQAKAIVFTIGLAEVWEDKETGKVFWHGIPKSIFNESRHQFRLSTTEENYQNLKSLVQTIRRINPECNIIFTLSPVPLKATFRQQSCVTADCVSKSILRVALDQLMREEMENVYYFPSYEIVKWMGCHLKFPAYGMEDGSNRHVSRFYVVNILKAFVRSYFSGDCVQAFLQGLRMDGIPDDTSRPFVYKQGKKLN